MNRVLAIVLGTIVAGATACGRSELDLAGAPSGAAGTRGAAGTTGQAGVGVGTGGVVGTGVAGTGVVGTGVAGTVATATGVAGTGAVGVAGTSGAGAAGSRGTSPGPPNYPNGQCYMGAIPAGPVCVCRPGIPDICGEQCVDLESSPTHCGACLTRCPSGACEHGVCVAAPEMLFFAPGCGVLELASGRGVLYWTEQNGNVRRRLPDGSIQMIASGELGPTRITVSENTPPAGTAVFWVNQGDRALRRSLGPGLPPITIATNVDRLSGVAVSPDGASIYYATGSSVMKVPAAGGLTFPVAEVPAGSVSALAFAGDRLAFVTGFGNEIAAITPRDDYLATCGSWLQDNQSSTRDCLRLAQSSSQNAIGLRLLLGRPGAVFWGDGAEVRMTAAGAFRPPMAIASTGAVAVGGLAMSGNTIYFSAGAQIFAATVGPNQPARQVARNLDNPQSLAVDDKYVYWATINCLIQRIEQ